MPLHFVTNLHHDVYPSIDPKFTLRGVAEGKVIVLAGEGKGIGEVRQLLSLKLNIRRSRYHLLKPAQRGSSLPPGQKRI